MNNSLTPPPFEFTEFLDAPASPFKAVPENALDPHGVSNTIPKDKKPY